MLKQQHQLFVALLVVVDGLIVVAASFAAWSARVAVFPQQNLKWEDPPKQALVFFTVPIVLFVMRWFGLYRPRRDRSLGGEARQVVKAAAISMLVLLAFLYLFDSSVFRRDLPPKHIGKYIVDSGRIQLGSLMVILPIFLVLHRTLFRTGLRLLRRRGWNQRHVAIIGCGRLGQIVYRTLSRNSWTGIQVAYFISHQDQTRRTKCLDRPVRGGLNDLERVMKTAKPDAVYVALPSARSNHLTSILTQLEKFPVDVRVVPDVTPRYLPQSMAVSELDGMPILSYRECPTHGMGGVSKRILDILGACLGIALFSPLMLLAASLVRLGSPGPVIFKQRRVSLAGEQFFIYKFRTMHHVEDEDGRHAMQNGTVERRSTNGWTLPGDSRITGLGKWLRRTSLDELPQLFNVLRGEMSLVGPRPERPELIERFREDWRGYMLRQHVKAGMTGWAQVNGHRGHSSLRKRLQYDLFYIRHWSIGFDLKILWLTIFRGFVHRNAH